LALQLKAHILDVVIMLLWSFYRWMRKTEKNNMCPQSRQESKIRKHCFFQHVVNLTFCDMIFKLFLVKFRKEKRIIEVIAAIGLKYGEKSLFDNFVR